MLMNRHDVTEMIVTAKIIKELKWAEIASKIGLSKEWTTAALLGQMTLTKAQADIIGDTLDLPAEAVALCLLTTPPSCPSIPFVTSEPRSRRATRCGWCCIRRRRARWRCCSGRRVSCCSRGRIRQCRRGSSGRSMRNSAR